MEGHSQMEFISYIEYEGGNYNSGVFSKAEYKDWIKELWEDWDRDPNITAIWVLPYDADEYPVGDGDRAGEFFSVTRN